MTFVTEAHERIVWPQAELEYLGACPACECPKRYMFFTNLTDQVFGVAPGNWSLWRCDGCGVVYLDPRPSVESIGRAYENYYTHQLLPRPGWLARLRKRMTTAAFNGYLNHQLGYSLKPSSVIGGYVYGLRPGRARIVSDFIRSLPPPAKPGARLLEIGPGNGAFLRVAKRLGYIAEGLDPDPKAVEVCRQSGLDVREGAIPQTTLPENTFEQVLLNHVFEHLHYPLASLELILKTLTPGGRLWMSMPNLQAAGLRRWGRNWRGLEPPRHLALYDMVSIERLLKRSGFHDIEVLEPTMDRYFIYPASRKIELGQVVLESSDRTVPPDIVREIARDDEEQHRDPTVAESLRVVAYKLGKPIK